MARARFYVDSPLAPGAEIALPERAARHVRVLRLGAGATITLFDGSGMDFPAEIRAARRGQIQVCIGPGVAGLAESSLHWHVGIAVLKRDAMNTALQKATELGATTITPVLTAFTDAPKGSISRRHDSWTGVCSSAAEQCGRARLPVLRRACPFAEALEVPADLRLLPDPGAATSLARLDANPGSVFTLIGPEGGFSSEEVTAASNAGFTSVSLGPRTLRAETAPAVLGGLLQSMWGDLG